MRVVIADPDQSSGQALADVIEGLLPTADVLRYDDAATALDGIAKQRPDVVFVAPAIGKVAGPELAAKVIGIDDVDATVVGIVDEPDESWSTRWVEAGAGVVVSRPVDELDVRVALRQRAGGIPGPT